VQQAFGRKGMEAKLTIPLTHERWPGPAPSPSNAPHAQAESPAL
jgi:hypothetical protein